MKSDDLRNMTRRQLAAIAAKTGLRGYSRLTRTRLIAALLAASKPESLELPPGYGHTRLTLLDVGPYLVYVYWEVTPSDALAAAREAGSDDARAQWVLRFHDVADSGAQEYFDIPVSLAAGNWYVHLWSAGKTYFAEIGLRAASGRFIPVSRSNMVRVPASGPPAGEDVSHRLAGGENPPAGVDAVPHEMAAEPREGQHGNNRSPVETDGIEDAGPGSFAPERPGIREYRTATSPREFFSSEAVGDFGLHRRTKTPR